YAGWQIADAAWTASTSHLTAFISAQNHYSLLERSVQADVIPACERFGVGMLPYFPLASGLLTGKYQRGAPMPEGARRSNPRFGGFLTDERWERKEKLEVYAQERSVPVLDVAIGGLAAMPAVASVIAGATTADQVRANVAAGAWTPSEADMAAL